MSLVEWKDDRAELTQSGLATVSKSPLYNEDLAPTPLSQRTWTPYNYFALWFAIALSVPAWLGAAGMVPKLTAGQAILGTFIGSLGMGLLIYLNGAIGSKYGVPMAAYLRSVWGPSGAKLAMFFRQTVSFGYAGIETFIGGAAIDGLLTIIAPAWAEIPGHLWVSYALFWAVTALVIWTSPPGRQQRVYKLISDWSPPILVVFSLITVYKLYTMVGSLAPVFAEPATEAGGAWWAAFIAGTIGVFGMYSDAFTDAPNFSRYSLKQNSHFWGGVIGFPLGFTFFGSLGIIGVTLAKAAFGKPIWNPVEMFVLTAQHAPLLAVGSLIVLSLATITTNMGVNLVSGGYFFTNLAPARISWRVGGLLTMVVGTVIMPWKLLATYGDFLFYWLLLYAAWIGPIGGTMLADYFVLKRGRASIADMYMTDGRYRYSGGWNWSALIAWAVGAAVGMYYRQYSVLLGTPIAFVLHYILSTTVFRSYAVEETPAPTTAD